MPRRKHAVAADGDIAIDHHTTPEGPVITAAAPVTEIEQAFRDAGITTGNQIAPPEVGNNGRQPRPIRETFTSSEAGVHAGEDKRFRNPQAFVAFEDDKRATEEEKADLKEAGFKYRPNDKGYTAMATPDSRAARDELVQKFTDRRMKEKAEQGEGLER